MIIYKAENTLTGKIYIGKTTQTLQVRINKHVYEAFKRLHKNKFHSAIREYGIEAFNFEIVGRAVNKLQLKKMERKFMIIFNTLDSGYNTQVR